MGEASAAFGQVIEAQRQEASEPLKFLFDFADVTQIDSSGLGKLIGLHISIAQKGGRVGVINVSKTIDDLLALTRLT